MTTTFFSQQSPIEPGVSKSLAEWRAKHYSNIRYTLNLTLEKGAPLMKGEIEIRVILDEEGAKNELILDWRTTQFQNDIDKPFANVTEVNGTSTLSSNETLIVLRNEHIIIDKVFLKKAENIIKIQFASPIKTSGSAITRYIDKEDGSEYIYSLFVPSDASTAFPVFDQPDLKARFKLNVIAPSSWNVISNTYFSDDKIARTFKKWMANDVVGSVTNPTVIEGKMPFEFEETKPISTYVFAFAAGDFVRMSEPSALADGLTQTTRNAATKSDTKKSTSLEANPQPPANADGSDIYVRKSQAEKFKPHAQEIFRLNRECVKYLEEYFDYKFPFPKYDLVLIPEFPFGGMEHAGATFLRESSVIFPSEPTKNDYISRAILIFHETAHQWFGDTVTMKWFDDLWLKEGFATFAGFKALDKIMPEMNAWKAFYERNKVAAYQTDSTRGTTPIYQEIANLSAAKSAYGAIVYSKAPSFLKQAEFYLGEKEFQTAVRSFLRKYEFKNATWQDLVTEFESSSSAELKSGDERLSINNFSNRWIRESGMPIIRGFAGVQTTWKPVKGNSWSESAFEIKSSTKNQKADRNKWTQKSIYLGVFEKGKNETANITFKYDKVEDGVILSSRSSKVSNYIEEEPVFVFPNYQDYGYGIFLLDEKSRNYILANVQNEKDDFLRAMMYGSLWDSVREAELDPKTFVELVIKNVATEKDETIVSSMLGRANTALNYYIGSEPPVSAGGKNATNQNEKINLSAHADSSDRAELTRKLEEILMGKMNVAETMGQRVTFYRSFLNVASSEKARNVLKDMLKGANKPEKVVKELSDTMRNGYINFVPLKTKDKFDIVTKLFILGDKDAENLLTELTKTETSDDAKRYAYAAKAGIPTAENKAKYWNDFVNNKEISESWIESAFVPFNSVRHSEFTLQYLEKALAELPNHKRNRKIFFVNGWLGAFIGGQKSEAALNIVNKFLAENPNLDKDLRLKILENIDVIERAVKIRKKFGKL